MQQPQWRIACGSTAEVVDMREISGPPAGPSAITKRHSERKRRNSSQNCATQVPD
jgi:hypothetical protein